jgi:hypothetical protein
MAQELTGIDTTQLESLLKIGEERKAIEELIDKAEGMRERVTIAVFERVVGDYRRRIEVLETQARPLREKASGELRSLRDLHQRLRGELEQTRLDQEEIAFRHQVGELDDAEYGTRHQTAVQTVASAQERFDAADGMLQRFLVVMPATAEAERPPDAPVSTQPTASAPTAAEEPDSRTEVLPREAVLTFETAHVQPARFVLETGGAVLETHLLGPTATVGRTPENQVVVPTREVSRRHASVELTAEGYALTDLDSGNGTYVNDERITRCLLKEGDRVRFGDVVLVFREG